MTDTLHLDDDAIETMVRAVIEAYLADAYRAVQNLRLVDGDES